MSTLTAISSLLSDCVPSQRGVIWRFFVNWRLSFCFARAKLGAELSVCGTEEVLVCGSPLDLGDCASFGRDFVDELGRSSSGKELRARLIPKVRLPSIPSTSTGPHPNPECNHSSLRSPKKCLNNLQLKLSYRR